MFVFLSIASMGFFVVANGDGISFYFTNNESLGEQNSDVLNLQQYLFKQGYFKQTPTSYFGNITRSSLKMWQKDHGLPSTGYFGPLSRALINADASSTIVEPSDVVVLNTAATTSSTTSLIASSTTAFAVIKNSGASNFGILSWILPVTQNLVTLNTPAPVISVLISSSSGSIYSNATTSFVATVTNAANSVSWSAVIGSINSSGIYTAPTIYATTTDTITASSTASPGIAATTTITVLPLPVTMSLSPATSSVVSQMTKQFTATVSNASTSAVTWSALYGSINSSGLYTASTSSTTPIYDVVTATSVANPSLVATSSIITVPPNLLVMYDFRQNTGNTLQDITGNGYNGTWTGSSTYWSNNGYSYVSPNAGFCDGSSTTISVPLNPSLSEFTVSLWMNTASTTFKGQNPRLIADAHTDNSNTGFQLMFNSGGASGFFDIGSNNTEARAYWSNGAITIATGTWQMYTGVYDSNNQLVTAYINSNSVAVDSYGSGAISQGSNNISICSNAAYLGDYYDGLIDDVRIYNVALSQSQIKAIYNAEGGVGGGQTYAAIINPAAFNFQPDTDTPRWI